MTKKVTYYSVKAISILLTVFLLLMCLFFGYIFYCNLVKMEIPTLGNFRIYAVLSDSMAPSMVANDAIIVGRTDAAKLKAGDVITFYAFESDIVVTHRIVEINKTENGLEFITKGDNNNVADGFVTHESRVIGKYFFRLPQFGGFLTGIKDKPYAVILPVALIILVQLLLGYIEAKLKPEQPEKNVADTKEPSFENAAVEKPPETETGERFSGSGGRESWNQDAQTLLKKMIGDAKIELDQMKKEARAEAEKIIGDAETEAKKIREDARGEIVLMKYYAEKMLEEANAKVAAAQEKAQKIIGEAQAEAARINLASREEREQTDENIRQLINKLQGILEPLSPGYQITMETPVPEKPPVADKPDHSAESGFVGGVKIKA